MQAESARSAEAPARVLALMIAANGRLDERELRALEDLDAFRRIGVPRERFMELGRACLQEIGSRLCEKSWLSFEDRRYLDRVLSEVRDPNERLLVCRLAAAVITADGRISGDERLVYEHTLATWHISQTMVSHAIMNDRPH